MTEAELVEQGEVVRGFLVDLLDAFGLDGEVTATPAEEGAVELAVAGDDLGLLIGPKGATLQAVQELSRSMLQRTRPGEAHARVRVGRPLVEQVVAPRSVDLPVDRGERLGEVRVYRGGTMIARRPLVAATAITKPGVAGRQGSHACASTAAAPVFAHCRSADARDARDRAAAAALELWAPPALLISRPLTKSVGGDHRVGESS